MESTLPAHVDPNAEYVDLRGCTNLAQVPAFPNATETLEQYKAVGGGMERFLTGGGMTMREIAAAGAFECHQWENCPTHVAYGVSEIDQLPADKQRDGVIFIGLFDGKLLEDSPAIAAAKQGLETAGACAK